LSKPVERYTSARRRIEARRGRPADFIRRFDSIQPGETVDLLVAVSGRERKRNLPDQVAWLRLKLQERGAFVGNITPVKGRRYAQELPRELCQAAIEAKRQGRKLLAVTTDRFIRDYLYHSTQRPNRQVNDKFDLEDLQFHTRGVKLVTWLDPAATPEEVRAFRTKLGQWAKGDKGGRPRKRHRKWKARRERWDGLVRRLLAKGLNSRQIWLVLQERGEVVTYRTVRNWVVKIGM
jgi:hypothetical protein